MERKIILICIIAAIVLLAAIVLQSQRINALRDECSRYKTNTEILSSDCEKYRTKDSLSAARVKALTLNLEEYERLRAADAALISSLTAKNRELRSVNETQMQTIIEMSAAPRDTVIIRDSVPTPAVAVHCGDPWYEFDGLLTDKTFEGKLVTKDSLIISETVQHKRFLGFLWKMKAVKNRQIDAVSRNPHTNIDDIVFVVIED